MIFMILGLMGVNVFAQQTIKLSLLKYAQSDGLSSYNIRQIIKDKKDFLWIATQDGLTRFDGNVFQSYTKQSMPAHRIAGPDVRQVIEDTTRNVIWVLPNNNGLNAISTITGNVVRTIPLPPLCNEDWNITMIMLNNRIWIGSFCGLKIYDIKQGRFLPAPHPDIQEKKHPFDFEVNCLAKDNYNNIWVCYSGYGVVIYDGTTLSKIKEIRLTDLHDYIGNGMIRFNSSIQLNHAMLFATSQGLRKINYDKSYFIKVDAHPCLALPVLNNTYIETIAIVQTNRVLVAGNNHLYQLDTLLKHYSIYDESLAPSESKWINAVQAIYSDGNIIWLGCQQGVAMIKNINQPFTKYFYDEQTGNKLEHLRSIAVLTNGDILCGLNNGLAYVDRDDGGITMEDRKHLYHHIFTDSGHVIHLCRDDGMFILSNGHIQSITTVYPEFKPYRTFAFNSHLFLNNSEVLMGTEDDNGIIIWNYKKHSIVHLNHTTIPSLASNIVNNVYLDKRNRVWVLSDNLITLLDSTFTTSSTINFSANDQNASLGLFFDMCEARGAYWLASYGNGLLQIDSNLQFKRLFRTSVGLCDEGVYDIFNSGDSALFITTNKGLSVYHIQHQQFKSYYKNDGLHSSAFEEVAATSYKHKIYAGGIDGFTIIDPSRITTNTTPPTFYFTNIQVRAKDSNQNIDTTNVEIKRLTVPDSWLQTTIYFTGINYSNPERVTYQYRIKERSTGWVNNNHQHFISIIGLNPGTYHLEVKAANEDGYWSEPKTLTLIFKPKWFQTWWFYMLVALAVTSLIYGFYRYRIAQIKIQQAKLHQVREEIASDLHDDIGSTLNTIKIFSHLAQVSPEKQQYFAQIQESLKQASEGLRDMIWVLDDKNDTAAELMERLEKLVQPAAEASGIAIKFDSDGVSDAILDKTEKRNLLLIAKEAINNSIKYAQCKNIKVSFTKADNSKMLTIYDDGKGFSKEKITPGNGLINMRMRAKQIRYNIVVNSVLDHGTTISLTSDFQVPN